jgi:hypothetical protein
MMECAIVPSPPLLFVSKKISVDGIFISTRIIRRPNPAPVSRRRRTSMATKEKAKRAKKEATCAK